MFESARLKLTAWYLLIIMLISILFSVAFYHASTREIQHIIDKIEFKQQQLDNGAIGRPPPPFLLEELQRAKQRLKFHLVILNVFIFIIAGAAGYFLAGRTLRPIKGMIDEQNQFISNASHELRTPIATLRAEMEGSLLERKLSDKKARGLIKSNLEELDTLQELSNNLLKIAQIHNTNPGKYMEKVSLLEIIKSATKKVSPLAKRKQISIKTDVTNTTINGNISSLREVFVILLDNAIKYSPNQSTVNISTEVSKRHVKVFVSDQGVGIAKKDLPHIFERFYRADKSRNQDGFGLGLSIAKKIIAVHSGSITVRSKENSPARNALNASHNNAGGGTTFIFELPL